jgi:hypothetical protein
MVCWVQRVSWGQCCTSRCVLQCMLGWLGPKPPLYNTASISAASAPPPLPPCLTAHPTHPQLHAPGAPAGPPGGGPPLRGEALARAAAEALLGEALRRGSLDNVTVIVALLQWA